ncbi:coronin-1B-like, partial [Limulus polyphemus]|uniref:Coronin n=1 Tax=Limulus polyphemus TaxID=6850 RepID=A0ABM1BV16_LIMPO
MSFRIVRQSKFRHVFGQPLKREQCYDNIRITKNSWDSNFCAVNPKFLAIITEIAGGGAFLVLPLFKTGRIDVSYPQVAGHKGPVMDIAWCPHNDNVIASASDDTFVRVWHIPDGGLVRPLVDPVVELMGHQKRVGLIQWHMSANNVLLSAGETEDLMGLFYMRILKLNDILYVGMKYLVGQMVPSDEAMGHEGTKPQRAIYLRNGLIFTTGFSRMSERQYALRSE